MRNRELQIQIAVIRYIQYKYPDILYCASAGGMWTTPYQGRKMKESGYVKGYPDIAIHEPRGKYHGLFIELKTKTGRIQPEQKEWQEKLRQRGYCAEIVRETQNAITLLDDYLCLS